jgi:hypothetical protein
MPDYIFWQSFEEKKLFVKTDSILDHCILTRDENYSIHIVLSGVLPDITTPLPRDYLSRIFGRSEPLVGTGQEMPGTREYQITNYYFEKENIAPDNTITLTGYALNVEEQVAKTVVIGSPEFVIHWFLNSNAYLNYPQSLEFEGHEETVVRFGNFAADKYNRKLPRSFGRSLFELNFKGHRLVFGLVDEKVSKVRASFIRFDRGYFPEGEEVRELSLTLSYLFGTSFIHVGHTVFNAASAPISQRYVSTLHPCLERVFNQVQLPPIPIRLTEDISRGLDPEVMINKFLIAFVQKKDELKLVEVLWYMNQASLLDIFLSMQPLASAFDVLCQSCLSQRRRTTIVDSERFSTLIESVEELLYKIFGKSEESTRLLGNIKGTNRIGSGQRYSLALSELGLQVSEVERSALKERNAAVHGSVGEDNLHQRMFLTRVFYTLLNRMLLAALVPDIPYVDYSTTRGMRVGHVSEAQEGTEQTFKIG